MERNNIYTYKRSEVPALDDTIKQEMAEISLAISNFISNNSSHYRALSAFMPSLEYMARLCEIKLESIIIISDYDEMGYETNHDNLQAKEFVSLNNLPPKEKEAIAFESLKAKCAIQLLAYARGWNMDEVLTEVQLLANDEFSKCDTEQTSEIVHKITQNLQKFYDWEK